MDEGWDGPIRNPPPAAPTSCPSPERNQYNNKDAAKMNSAMSLLNLNDNVPGIDPAKILLTGVAIDLDSAPGPAAPTIERLVRILTHPQPHAFPHGMLCIDWVRSVLFRAREPMIFRQVDERFILAPDSKLRAEGRQHGMPEVYMEWLCGDNSELCAAEQQTLLTRDFFELLEGEMEAKKVEDYFFGPPENRKKSRYDW